MPNLALLLHPLAPSWSGANSVLPFSLPEVWQDWLFDAGSLTARLTALSPEQFRVEVLAQYYGQATPVEQAEMGLGLNQKVWVREVKLLVADEPLVYARTAIPVTTLTGKEKCLQALGNRSLGSYLFVQPNLKRGELRASRCAPNTLNLAWSRRSIFFLGDKPLLVSEAFSRKLLDFL